MTDQFNLNYAPHINLFTNSAGQDPFDQIKYIADLGFKSIENSGFNAPHIPFDTSPMGLGLFDLEPAFLDKMGNTIANAGLTMGTFVMTPPVWPPVASITSGNKELLEMFLKKCKKGVEVGQRINAKFVTVSTDCYDRSLPMEMQTAHAIDALRYAADIFEPVGITMVIETLSDHHELFLRTAPLAYLLCRGVNRASCKMLFDMYHLQRNQGGLIAHIDMVWSEIGYFQIGDVPGRCEPGTGEINYKTIFKHIYHKQKAEGKDLILGMEHFKSRPGIEGENALLQAYKEVDNFLN
ncbi:MAG: TIM barrel protein [Spirosomataceae bacterium]